MEPGAIVAERYLVERFADKGGMCSVFRARDRDGTPVALKVLHYQDASTEGRFRHEVEILERLRHPAIVRYLDSGTTDKGQRFLVMEWLEGMDLAAFLKSTALSLAEVLQLASRVAHALAAAHEASVVHRDVKPGNIFVPRGDVGAAKLIDFGVARWGAAASALTATGVRLGTPAYMAPEQVRGERDIGPQADVFALGCVIYECLTGAPAFAAHHPMAVFCKILLDKVPRLREVAPDLPPGVDELLDRMLGKDPASRPRDGAAIAAELDALAASLPLAVTHGRRSSSRRAATANQALTAGEQRLVNVIVAAGARMPGPGDTMLAESAVTMPTISRQLDPEQLIVDEMSATFDVLADGSLVAVVETRGTATDQAVQAARYALGLRDAFPRSPMALATGRAIMARDGVLGEVIERACQLLALGGEGSAGIRLDEVTARLVELRFDIERDARGPLLQGERPRVAERMLLGKPTPFVGRGRELSTLITVLDQCVADEMACAVLVTGPAGYGKSRLRSEFLAQVHAREGGVEVWTAFGDPMRSGSPLHLIADAVRRVADVMAGVPLAVRQRRLARWIRARVAAEDAPRLVEFLGELVDTPAAGEPSVQMQAARVDPVLMGDQVRRAVEDLVDAHTRERPLVLILEDLHWGDQATVALIDGLLRRLVERPFMVVVLARPELHRLFPGIWMAHNATEIRLGPLSRRAAVSLVRAVLGDHVDDGQMAGLVERADGNAFYLEELVRNAAAGQWDLPETLLAMVHARLNALAPEARRVLRAASVFGGEFWRGGLVRLVGNEHLVDEWLDELVARELIANAERSRFPHERAYRFRHDLVREGAYGMLVEEDRVLGHLLAGEWLEAAGESSALLLAAHFERGGAPERALPLYLRAAEEALRSGDFHAAIRLAERGERCGARGEVAGALRRVQVDAHHWRGDYADADRACVEAMALLPRGSRAWYDVAGQAVVVWGTLGHLDRIETLAREVLEERAASEDRDGRLTLIARAASRLVLVGRVGAAQPLYDAVEAEVADVERMDVVVAAYLHRARASRGLVVDGDPSAFLREMERSAACFDEIGDARHGCFQRANVGYAQLALGLYEEAEGELRAAVATAERMGLDSIASVARSNLGVVLMHLGRVRDACALEQRAAQDLEAQGDIRQASAARTYLAMALLLEGDLARAEAEVRAAIDQCAAATMRIHRSLPLAVLARVLLAREHHAEALEAARAALALLEEAGAMDEGESLIRLVHAEALHACGRQDEARAAIAGAWARLGERAEHIGEAGWRRSFLEKVPEHARTGALARAWAG